MFDRAGRRPGIMMLNTKMQPVGWLPIGGLLRGELRNTGGMNALFRAASESSMESAIIVHGGELDGKIDREFYPDLSIAENIGAALELGDIRVVDILRAKQKTGFESAAEFGNRVSAGPVLSRRTASGNAALTGKQYSAKIKPSSELLNKVYEQFGDVESEFRAATGYGFDALTESEARYMAKHNEAKSVRDRIVEAGRKALKRANEKNPGLSRPTVNPAEGLRSPAAKPKTGFESAAEFGNCVSAGPVLSRRTASGNAALTGKHYSAKINLSSELLRKVYEQFGDVESEFRAATGYGFDALTESEARYMAKHNEAKSVRDRIIEAGRQALNGADEKNTGFSRKEDVTIENTRARTDAGMDVVTLEKLAQRIKAKMPNMPMVNVLADPSQAPDALRDYILEQGA